MMWLQNTRAGFAGEEGVLFIGKAQEKVPVFRTEKRRNPQTGGTYPWIVRSTGLVNQYYFYCIDRDFGPFFLKFCSYFPYNGKLCINGHEYAKRQLSIEGIGFEALDNGILRCADPARLQAICDGLSAEKIDGLARKWFRILPHPFTPADGQAGYLYDLSILQAEFSLTQVLDQPVTGRIFFEEVIRENLDLGRPEKVQLIFDRKIIRKTPGRFQTRVITPGVIPSLHVTYKNSRIKQYYKEGRALRTETTINDTRDFKVGKTAPQPNGSTKNWLSSQPTSPGRPEDQSRLHLGRSCVRTSGSAASKSRVSGLRRCASMTGVFRRFSVSLSCSSSKSTASPIETSASLWLNCWASTPARSLQDK